MVSFFNVILENHDCKVNLYAYKGRQKPKATTPCICSKMLVMSWEHLGLGSLTGGGHMALIPRMEEIITRADDTVCQI
jgi:hypothetical protein